MSPTPTEELYVNIKNINKPRLNIDYINDIFKIAS